jgi:plasmid stability protein
MATVTVRNLDDRVKRELRKRAAEHGVSMEQEVRRILIDTIDGRNRAGRKPTVDELLAKYSRPPGEPFDQKAFTDELWDFAEES